MSLPVTSAEETLGWARPPVEEGEENQYSFTPDDALIGDDRIIVRLSTHIHTDDLAEFAVIQQAHVRGRWQDVASGDSCHDDDVHVHYYARSTGERTGEPEVLMAVRSQADLHAGYDALLSKIMGSWAANRSRWDHA